MTNIVNCDGKVADSEGFKAENQKLDSSGPTSTQPSTHNGPVRPSLVIPTVLMAVHGFEARSPDELTFRKGEHIEVLERDEEFNDGWYLGRSLATNEKGLFPQVYTTPTEVALDPSPAIITTATTFSSDAPPSYMSSTSEEPTSPATTTTATAIPATPQPPKALPDLQQSRTPSDSCLTSETQLTDAVAASETHTPSLTLEKGRSTR